MCKEKMWLGDFNVFSSEMTSTVNEDNFQLFLSQKEKIKVKKMTLENLTFYEKCISVLRNWYSQNHHA